MNFGHFPHYVVNDWLTFLYKNYSSYFYCFTYIILLLYFNWCPGSSDRLLGLDRRRVNQGDGFGWSIVRGPWGVNRTVGGKSGVA